MNKLMIIGNLTRDPEVRQVNTANGPTSVCSFTVAVNRRQGRSQNGQEQTDFIRVSVWGARGDACAKYLSKGKKVFVTGPVTVNTFQRNDGTTGASMEMTADDFEFLSSRNDGTAPAAPVAAPVAAPAAPAAPTAQNNGFTQVDNDELPF